MPAVALALFVHLVATPVSAPAEAEAALEAASVALRFGEHHKAAAQARAALLGAQSERARLAAHYLLGRALLELGEPNDAVTELARVAESNAPFRPGAWLALGEALTATGDGVAALRAFRELPASYRDGERRFEIGLARGAAHEAAGQLSEAESIYRGLLRKWHPRLPKDEVVSRLARVTTRLHPEAGRALYRRLFIEYPASPFAETAREHIGEPLDAEEERRRVFGLYKAREYHAALSGLHALVEHHPRDLELRMALGRLHGMVLRDDREQAARHLRAILAHKGRDERKAEAAWRLTVVLGALDRTDEALAVARDYKRSRYGRGYGAAIDYRVARLHHEAGHATRARAAYKRYLKRHKPRDRTMYAWFVGWAAFRGGKYRQAIADFAPLLPHPNLLVGAKALYWTGVAHHRLGERKEAVHFLERVLERFPLCYYAVLAHRKLAELGEPRPLPGADTDYPPPRDEDDPWAIGRELPRELARRLDALRWLVLVGDAPEARALYETLAPRLRRALSTPRFARYDRLWNEAVEAPHGPRHAAWRVGRRALTAPPSPDNIETWRAIYPRAYRRYARAAAARETVPELLLYCHMLQESRYKRFAVSSAPAYGVMQFLEKTGRRASAALEQPYARERLLDPAYNIRLGAYYLAALIRRHHGQIALAIGAYNGGPRLMTEHLARWGHLPFDEMVEEIDRHETRNYIRKVLDHYVRYVQLYLPPEDRAAAIAAAFPTTVDPSHEAEPSY